MNRIINYVSCSGVVLAGGKSSRFGQDKGLFLLDGKPLVLHALSSLEPLCKHVFVSTNQEEDYRAIRAECITDIYQHCGPMGGIHSALTHAKGDYLLVTGCDTPFVPNELYRFLLDHAGNHQVVIPTHKGYSETLCSIFKVSCLPLVEEALQKKKFKILDAIEDMDVLFLDVENEGFYHERIFHNINYRDDARGISNTTG